MTEMIKANFDGDDTEASRIYFRLAPFFAGLNRNGRIKPIPILRGAIETVSGIKIGPPESMEVRAPAAEFHKARSVLDVFLQESELAHRQT